MTPDYIVTVGAGESVPIASNKIEEGRVEHLASGHAQFFNLSIGENNMKLLSAITSGVLLALIQTHSHAAGDTDLFGRSFDTQEYLQLADRDNRQDRRDERGRRDERQDRRDCRQEEGRVGKDKRDCKQEEVRDGVKGNRKGGDDD
jgi:hypothetical protein